MKSINGIPVRWDLEADKALFKNLFDNVSPLSNIEVKVGPDSPSLFKDSPFGEDWDKKKDDSDNIEIVPESKEPV